MLAKDHILILAMCHSAQHTHVHPVWESCPKMWHRKGDAHLGVLHKAPREEKKKENKKPNKKYLGEKSAEYRDVFDSWVPLELPILSS